MIIKARSPFTVTNTEPSPTTELPRFTCGDTVITGLAIAADGTVTNPTVSVGTFHSIEPSSFSTVEVDTTHNVVVYVTYDSSNFRPPSETSTEIGCVVQVTQDATVPTPTCNNWQLRNPHPTEQAFYQYTDCSNNLVSGYLAAATNLTICAYQGTVPLMMVDQNLAYPYNLNTSCT